MTTSKKSILYHRKVRNFVLGSEWNGRGGFQLGKMGLLLSFMDIQSSMCILLVLYHSHDSNFLKTKLVGSCFPCLLLNAKKGGTCAWFVSSLSRLL